MNRGSRPAAAAVAFTIAAWARSPRTGKPAFHPAHAAHACLALRQPRAHPSRRSPL